MKLGIVGLPNVGKSTLFNAITNAGAQSANYAFCTIEPNVGVVAVPDSRLDELAKMYNPELYTPAVIEFVDIAGLVKGASKGEGLGNKFLSHIREVDAIIHGYRRRNRLTHQLLAEIVYTTTYAMRDPKGKTVEGMFPMLFDDDDDDSDEPIMTKEDSDELQQLMVDLNNQQNPDK